MTIADEHAPAPHGNTAPPGSMIGGKTFAEHNKLPTTPRGQPSTSRSLREQIDALNRYVFRSQGEPRCEIVPDGNFLALADVLRVVSTLCECGGEIVGSGGLQDYGGTHEGYVWGGNCVKCGRGYGENEDQPPASASRGETPPRDAPSETMTHSRTCAHWQAGGECTCCLQERINAQTLQTLYDAWRKRATEAEAALSASQRASEESRDPARPYSITFSEEEFTALNAFMSYGATRGNHRDDGQPGNGALTPYVTTMVNLNTRMSAARAAQPEGPANA